MAAALVLIFAGKANAGINYWTTRGPQGGRVSALVVDPVTPANLYSGTEMGVFKSTDRTGSWFVPSQDLMGLSVYSLAIDPITPTTLYAGAGAEFCCSGVFKSTDAGVSWTAVGTGVTSDAFALAIDPTDPATIYAGGSDGAIFKSTDAGNTWTTVLSPAPAGSINALAIDPATPSTIYAADAEGVLKSVDGGETWSWAGAGLPAGVVVALAIHPNVTTTLYAGTVESGVFQSVDGGDTWSAANSGLPDTTVQAIAIDPATPTTLYAGTSDRGVFKSTDAGGTWTSFNDGLGNFDVSTVVIDPHTPKIVYAGTSSRVYQMDQRTIPNLVFLVNGTEDAHDADPGDGICDDGTGVCTLRAAAEESAWWSNIGPCQEGAIESGATLAVSGDIDLNAPVSFQAGGCYRSVTVTGPGAGSLTIRGGGLIFGGSAGAGERASVSGVTVTAAPVGITYLGAALGYPRDVSLSDLVVIGNGTGIEYGFRTRLTLRNCVIAENAADGIGLIPSLAGNSIEIFDSAVRNNGGAGILANVLRIVVARSIVSGNAGEGVTAGGIGQPYVEISDSTISSNGGAGLSIRSQGASIAGSTISGNAGGGVLLRAGPLMMMNSTVSGNESVGSGGGVFVSATGGGPVTLRNVTVADNTADSDGDGTGDGGGIYVELGTVTLSNTIVAGNTDRGGESPDCGGGLTSGGYNLILNTTGCVITGDPTGNLIGVEPFLGTLEDNGGLTETIALLPRSPAIDAANPGGCVDADGQPLTTDQRGVARPQLAACDIGAYEFACGNSVVDVAEECDDGNAIQGDGCSDVCEVEPGFECSGEPSICVSRLPEVSVSPQQYDFGQVDLGTSSTQIVTVSNTGGASLNVSDLALLPGVGAGFAFESPVSLPLEIAPGATVDVGLSFTPVDDGAASATLQITSDDPDEPLIEVPLTGFGVSYDEQSMALLTFFDELVASGDLVGEGPGNSAPGRLNALRNMIEASGDLIEQGQTAEACGQLEDARRRTDGLFPPPDFASGPAAPDLEAEIAQLRSNLRCDDPPATSLVRSGGTGRCGLGVELAFALPALAWLRRDRRRSAAA